MAHSMLTLSETCIDILRHVGPGPHTCGPALISCGGVTSESPLELAALAKDVTPMESWCKNSAKIKDSRYCAME